MKKYVSILFATAVAALAMVSCQKNIQEENVIEKEAIENPIHFYAEEIATKTEFGALSAGQYPTLWTANKGIKISYNKKTSVEATVTPKDGNTKADFTPASTFTPSGDSHIFYAMSPSSAQGANISSTYYSWRFVIPDAQTPLDGSVDEGAQILYAKYDAGDTFPTSVPFSFSHVTAYGKLSFANLALDGDEDVTSITLTASKDWVGQWFYYVATKDPNTEGDFTARENYVSKKLTLNTDKTSDIWFACAPVDLSNGGTIDINVVTTKGIFTKKVTFPAGKGNFQAGHVGAFTVNMSGITRAAKVNSIAEIKALYTSDDVLFVAELSNALVTLVSSSNFYLQDASGAILGFTSGHGLAVGDKLNGIISGTVTKYQGNYEITAFESSATKTTGNTVTPATVAHATLVDDFADYESEYVKVEELTVSAVSGKDITVSENANLKVRNETGNDITVGSKINAVGVACYYNTTKQVKIFSLAEEDKLAIGSVITASNKSVTVGSTVSIGATTNSPATITYESDDETVATVDASGVITGVKVGTANITCSVVASGKYTASSKKITVTVSAASEPEEHEATISFNSGATKINAASVTGDDSQGNTWTITTVGTTSYTSNAAYYQVGSSSKPATSITFTTTLSASATDISLEAKFGGFSGTAGTVTLKVGDTSIGTGSLNAGTDVVVNSSTTGAGTVLTVTVTGISKGVKCYYIKATYTN